MATNCQPKRPLMQRFPCVTHGRAVKSRDDFAVLRVNGQVAAHAAVRADGIGLSLAGLVPFAGLAHVVFALEHQRARGADADAVSAIDAGRIGQRNVDIRWRCAPRSRVRRRRSRRCSARPRRRPPRTCSRECTWNSRACTDRYRSWAAGPRWRREGPKRSGAAP